MKDKTTTSPNSANALVSGVLPMYDVHELNEIVKLYNSGEIDLYTCIGRVWNKAYFIGANEGMKSGSFGR